MLCISDETPLWINQLVSVVGSQQDGVECCRASCHHNALATTRHIGEAGGSTPHRAATRVAAQPRCIMLTRSAQKHHYRCIVCASRRHYRRRRGERGGGSANDGYVWGVPVPLARIDNGARVLLSNYFNSSNWISTAG